MTPGCRRWPPHMCGDEASSRASGDTDPPGKRSGRADDMKPGQRGDEAGSKRGGCRVKERCPGSLRPSVPCGDDKQDPGVCPEGVVRATSGTHTNLRPAMAPC